MSDEYDHDKTIEVFCDYRRGLRNIETGKRALAEAAGIDPNIAEVFLRAMKRDNVRDIRGYERTPERKVIPREGKLVADLIGFLQRCDHGNGVALYLYSMLDDAQISALRAGPFREDAVPSWARARRAAGSGQ